MDRSQAVIEFKLDGTILHANANFLGALGYQAAEIEGRHHSLFVPPAEAQSADYRAFWARLNARRVRRGQVPADRQGRQGGLDPGLLQSRARRDRQALQGHQVRHRRHRHRA
jgi:PAS domain S-box-containing protein